MKKGIQKIESPFTEIADFSRFVLAGDPGCDGLGAEIMSVFADILDQTSDADFTFVIGDVVPFGSGVFYQNIANLINAVAGNPVFVACGNHDTVHYGDYFGRTDYALADSRTVIIALDDSKRIISGETLSFLKTALRDCRRNNIILALHIPPPNPVSKNSIKDEEWKKIDDAFAEAGLAPDYVLAGHLHSYFEASTQCGGREVPLVCSGGAGARIEEVAGISPPYNHWVEFNLGEDGTFHHKRCEVAIDKPVKLDEALLAMYRESYRNECEASVRYRLYAEDAARRGFVNLAKLFRAASDAEQYHARNFFYCMNAIRESRDAVRESLAGEKHEVEAFYKKCLDWTEAQSAKGEETAASALARYAFTDAREAEKTHQKLFETALARLERGEDMEEREYYTCTSCGYTFALLPGAEPPKNCPVCGAPCDKIVANGT